MHFASVVVAALTLLLTPWTAPQAEAADPLVVISVTASGTTTVCDTGCVTCTVGSGECILVGEEDLLLCKPTSSGIPITGCDWSHFLDGDAPDLQINTQQRALHFAASGSLAFVALNDTAVPGIGTLLKQDIAVLTPDDLLRPFTEDLPYDDGAFKLYLNGDLT